MANKVGKMSVEFIPAGPRYEYHSQDPPAEETEPLTHVLAFCDELNKTFRKFFGSEHRANDWWTEDLDIEPDAQDQVPIGKLVELANERLKAADIKKALLEEMKPGLGKGIVYSGTGESFPETFAAAKATDTVMEFKAEEPTLVERTYYMTPDGKIHCTGLLSLLANDNELFLAEEGVVDSRVRVALKVDFALQA